MRRILPGLTFAIACLASTAFATPSLIAVAPPDLPDYQAAH